MPPTVSSYLQRLNGSINLLQPRFPKPGWRNWQTQRTQNPPVLSTVGVQLPLPAPELLGIESVAYDEVPICGDGCTAAPVCLKCSCSRGQFGRDALGVAVTMLDSLAALSWST